MTENHDIDAIERRLWSAADTLRANSNYASNEYFMPVMGLIFLRHAYSRYLNAKIQIEAKLPSRNGKIRTLTKEDFSQKMAIFLHPHAQFEYLVNLPDSEVRAKALIEAMNSIEEDYKSLKDVLPKKEYQELDNEVLGKLLRILNPDELKTASGDVFGRIYEYFLTQFADQAAHDGGEFFTPISLVSTIANVLEPTKGIVLDPACGSGGMFVQSAHFVERLKKNPSERLTFYGLEKNGTTINLAKMNLAVHGLEGSIKKAITYYEDPHELVGKADYVLANPPFNVDEVDADRIKRDPRLPFGLPGVNKGQKVSNGNYLWISYFYSYLNDHGKAGFVMSSQASSAGRDEAKVRQKLIETGNVDLMIGIRSNFFYTRTVPCELWFLNKAKPKSHANKVLMIDARSLYRKVTRKIYDFSPEQQQNILAITWLYREEQDRVIALLNTYCERSTDEARKCIERVDGTKILQKFAEAMTTLAVALKPASANQEAKPLLMELRKALTTLEKDIAAFSKVPPRHEAKSTVAQIKKQIEALKTTADQSHELVKQIDQAYKLACQAIDHCEKQPPTAWTGREINRIRKTTDEIRLNTIKQMNGIRYYWRQAHWLIERFPELKLEDVPGLVKVVDLKELEENDWSLTPGRYVGVAPEEIDEDFDFEETLQTIHAELEDLNAQATELAAKIATNFKELGI